ncbi:GDP-mannose 4,6-dehydratase [Rosistilla carotiformis]|nr:GDP-mannose 4,6-dehydratase [Rosistilla carotiformis]
MRKALITGISGQDGSYLAELLLSKGYEVHGLVRRSSNTVRTRLEHLFGDPTIYNQKLFLHYADIDDTTTIRRLLLKIQPSEVYHLAGQSHVGASFEIPESTCEFTAMGTLRLLELLRDLPERPRMMQISSSEIFGRPADSPQHESTPMNPVSPYGVAKAFATQMIRVYRDSFGFFACNAICFNHESPRRGESFVTRKISLAAARIKLGLQKTLTLGNLDAQRDWGYAPEYVEAFWKILQHDTPDDYVIATGKSHTLGEFLEAAFGAVDLEWRDYVQTDPRYMRPAESHRLVGNPNHAIETLDWQPHTKAPELAALMVEHDLNALRQHH